VGARLVFLGTGASGGTPGRGRSRRRESSVLVEDGSAVLLDATRDFGDQARAIERIDAVLLTHAHGDAAAGIPAVDRWARGRSRVRVLAAAETLASLRRRYRRLERCDLVAIAPRVRRRVAGWVVDAVEVPHAPDVVTYAWRLRNASGTLVYASDVARLTTGLRRMARGAAVLVVDGATWRRTIPSHLRIDRDLPELCGWEVQRILLTQIGRTAPDHGALERCVRAICRRARPAYDGMVASI
jgi:phosphoribosyl 1,2-cyclic phosphodiesterase